jgi:hypothetical protein
MTEHSRAGRRAGPAAAPLIGTALGASQAPDADPPDAETTELTQHGHGADSGPRLSATSAASVRDAAIAVLAGGVRYLPVVEDGTLVGVVAVAGARRPVSSVPPGAHTQPPLATVIGRRAG